MREGDSLDVDDVGDIAGDTLGVENSELADEDVMDETEFAEYLFFFKLVEKLSS